MTKSWTLPLLKSVQHKPGSQDRSCRGTSLLCRSSVRSLWRDESRTHQISVIQKNSLETSISTSGSFLHWCSLNVHVCVACIYLVVRVFNNQQHRTVHIYQIPVQRLEAGAVFHSAVGESPRVTLHAGRQATGQLDDGQAIRSGKQIHARMFFLRDWEIQILENAPSRCACPASDCCLYPGWAARPRTSLPHSCPNSAAALLHQQWWSEKKKKNMEQIITIDTLVSIKIDTHVLIWVKYTFL